MGGASFNCLIYSVHFFCLAVLHCDFANLEFLYLLALFLIPLAFVLIPLGYGAYGVSTAWCGIPTLEKGGCHRYTLGIVFQFTLWYVPILVLQNFNAVVIIAIAIALVYRSCHTLKYEEEREPLITQHNGHRNTNALKETLPLLFYPIIFYFLTIIPFIDQIYQSAEESTSFYIVLFHAITNGLWGFNCSLTQLVHILLNKRLRFCKRKKASLK